VLLLFDKFKRSIHCIFIDGIADSLCSGSGGWAAWLASTNQVGRLVCQAGEPPRQLLKEGLERRCGPIARGLSSCKFFAGAPEFLVTPLLMGLVSLIRQGRFEEPVHPCSGYIDLLMAYIKKPAAHTHQYRHCSHPQLQCWPCLGRGLTLLCIVQTASSIWNLLPTDIQLWQCITSFKLFLSNLVYTLMLAPLRLQYKPVIIIIE